jgi:hypothetical protein
MAQTIFSAGNAVDGVSATRGDDGTLVFKTGASGSQVNALTLAADGTPTFLKAPVNAASPAFSVLLASNYSIATSTNTKLPFNTREFDAGNQYDTTNSRFLPTIAGYYAVTVSIFPATTTTATAAYIYKNGSPIKRQITSVASGPTLVTSLVYMNGTTDYVEGWGFLTGTSPQVSNASDLTFFQGALISRSA